MIDWIIANKEWLFDGIGIIIISSIISLGIYYYRKFSKPLSVFYTKNDALWNEWLMPVIKNARPKRAFFLEYSSANIKPVIDILLEYGWQVTLLMKNPHSDTVKWRKEKIKLGLETLKRELAKELSNGKLDIYFYSSPGSIRIRYLENVVISVGWYTYDIRKGSLEKEQVWGHDNFMISAQPETKEWQELREFSLGVFERMKTHSVHTSELEKK